VTGCFAAPQGAQESVSEHLGRRAVEQHVARVRLVFDLAREAHGPQCSRTVDEHHAITGEALDLAHEQLRHPAPGSGVGEVRRKVLAAFGAPATDVDDAGVFEGHRLCQGQPDPARCAGEEDEVLRHRPGI
jgi:hypothetical protein